MAHDYPLVLLKEESALANETNYKEIENQIGEVFCILQEIRWFDAEVFKAYHLHSHSLKTLSNATGINKNTIYKAIKAAKNHLQKNTQRIRRHGGVDDSIGGEGRSRENRGGGLRMQQAQGMVEQSVSLLQSLERQRQEAMGRGVVTST